MNPLLSLIMGQAAAAPMAQQGLDANGIPIGSGDDILAVGNRNAPVQEEPYVDPYLDMDTNNSNAILANKTALEDGSSVAEREGMFGVKGTLRNVLGNLGDMFLVQHGADEIYRPGVEQQSLADAMSGYSVDPYAAGERMGMINPGAGLEMAQWGQTRDNQRATVQGKQRDFIAEQREQGMQLFGSFMGSADEQTWPLVRDHLRKIKEQAGLGEEFYIPEAYDPEVAEMYQMGTMPTSRQITARQGDERLRQGGERIRQGDERIDETRRSNRSREGMAAARVAQGERRTKVAEDREKRQSMDGRTARKAGGIFKRSDGKLVYIDSSGAEKVVDEATARAIAKQRGQR